MATHANSIVTPAVAAIHAAAIARSEGLKTTAQMLAGSLRDVMQEIHGGNWRVQIDHDAEFVMIARRADRPTAPKAGEVV